MVIEIREMRPADYRSCERLWRDASMHHESDFEARLSFLLKQNPGYSLVALSDGKVCGCILASYNGFSGYLFRLVVDPTMRGTGIGKSLSLECEKRLAAGGAAKATLACETELEPFYESLGYTKACSGFMMKLLA